MMVDRLTLAERSRHMSRVRRKDTRPEIRVRRAAHALGLRFRLHRKDLAGTPDLVFPRYRVALFVHGCFWHRHSGCAKSSTPKTQLDYWMQKFRENVERDERQRAALLDAGWSPAVIWECETVNPTRLAAIIRDRVTRIDDSGRV